MAAHEVMANIAGGRVDFVKFDIKNHVEAVEIVKQYGPVISSMPIKFDTVARAEP